ncbi:MAG: hypothetical protein ACTSP4_11325 [Candidatus Hodarchaeales archaeon]
MKEGIKESKTLPFHSELEDIRKILMKEESRLSEEVKIILKTCYTMMQHYPAAVRNFDLAKLHKFMAKNAQDFYNSFKPENIGIDGGNDVIIVNDVFYSYKYSSISFIFGTRVLLYPFMLLSVNYINFTSHLYEKIKKETEISLLTFLEIFYELYIKGKPKLTKRDITFFKKIMKVSFDNISEYSDFIRKYERTRRFNRLKYFRVLNLVHTINFPAIGLDPYIHLAPATIEIPDDIKNFIEVESQPAGKKKNHRIFRIFLLPKSQSNTLSRRLERIGVTGGIVEWYRSYNWHFLTQTRKFKWKWRMKFDDLNSYQFDANGRFDLFQNITSVRSISSGFLSYLDAIHRTGTGNPNDLAVKTGLTVQSIYRFHKKALSQKIIIPEIVITKIGLPVFYQVCFKNIHKNRILIDYFNSFPKIKAIISKELCRYLLFLPPMYDIRLKKLLTNEEKHYDYEILSQYRINLGSKSIESGVDLTSLCES